MRPEIICHIMSSVDGRLIPSRWTRPFDGTNPGELFKEYGAIGRTLGADAWMFGKATTAEFFPERFKPKSMSHPEAGKIHKGNLDSARLFITADPDADILYTSGTLRGDNILVILGTDATDDYLAFLEDKGISYIIMREAGFIPEALEIISREFGIRKISLQGGGVINGFMLGAGLIDELSLVVYPGIDGPDSAPSIFEYIGDPGELPGERQSLELLSAKVHAHGVVHLMYKIHHE